MRGRGLTLDETLHTTPTSPQDPLPSSSSSDPPTRRHPTASSEEQEGVDGLTEFSGPLSAPWPLRPPGLVAGAAGSRPVPPLLTAALSPMSPRRVGGSSPRSQVFLKAFEFNQNASSFVAATTRGFRVYRCFPLEELQRREESPNWKPRPLRIVSPLFQTNIVAFVEEEQPCRLVIWNDEQGEQLGVIMTKEPIQNVVLGRHVVVLVTDDTVYVYSTASMEPVDVVKSGFNPRGLCCVASLGPTTSIESDSSGIGGSAWDAGGSKYLHASFEDSGVETSGGNKDGSGGSSSCGRRKSSPSSEYWVVAFPATQRGGVKVLRSFKSPFDSCAFQAHEAPLAAMAMNGDGTLIATAADLGKVVLVHATKGGELLYKCWRGTRPHYISSIAFRSDNKFMSVASNSHTIHLYKLDLTSYSTLDPLHQRSAIARYRRGNDELARAPVKFASDQAAIVDDQRRMCVGGVPVALVDNDAYSSRGVRRKSPRRYADQGSNEEEEAGSEDAGIIGRFSGSSSSSSNMYRSTNRLQRTSQSVDPAPQSKVLSVLSTMLSAGCEVVSVAVKNVIAKYPDHHRNFASFRLPSHSQIPDVRCRDARSFDRTTRSFFGDVRGGEDAEYSASSVFSSLSSAASRSSSTPSTSSALSSYPTACLSATGGGHRVLGCICGFANDRSDLLYAVHIDGRFYMLRYNEENGADTSIASTQWFSPRQDFRIEPIGGQDGEWEVVD